MASLYLSAAAASTHLRTSTEIPPTTSSSLLLRTPKGRWPQHIKSHSYNLSLKSSGFFQNSWSNISCAINMAAGHSHDEEKINFHQLMDKARKLWDQSPQPIKSFPWVRVLENLLQLLLNIVLAVVKYLCVPVLGVSMLSEMSYCAHNKRLFFVTFPLLIGVAAAGILKETALELSPFLKDAEIPWHLLATAILFILLKLPGPYYPYWGRIFVPHVGNGALLRTMWFMFQWYNRSPGKL